MGLSQDTLIDNCDTADTSLLCFSSIKIQRFLSLSLSLSPVKQNLLRQKWRLIDSTVTVLIALLYFHVDVETNSKIFPFGNCYFRYRAKATLIETLSPRVVEQGRRGLQPLLIAKCVINTAGQVKRGGDKCRVDRISAFLSSNLNPCAYMLKYLRYRFVERQRFDMKERTRERQEERKAPSRFSDTWPGATAHSARSVTDSKGRLRKMAGALEHIR